MTAQEEKYLKNVAKNLTTLSKENGKISVDKVKSILAALHKKTPRHVKRLLSYYFRYLKRDILRNTMTVEYCGCIELNGIEDLQKKMNGIYEKDLTLDVKINPILMAGLRIHVGDDIWENSISSSIESLIRNLLKI